MATFTITTTQRIDGLSGKAGGDTYAINGGTLIIDQDSRYGLNQSETTGALGDVTISSVLGGKCVIDSRYTRIIPYDTGTGNVPALGSTISQGSVAGRLVGVWSAINVAPTASGASMPASGWIKVKEVSQVPGYSAGVLTGIGATATGEDKAGWLEIVADESKTCTVPRLGEFQIQGDWFEVGTVGADNTVEYQLPTSGKALTAGTGTWFAGVFVATVDAPETDADYEFYPSMGTLAGATFVGTDQVRGRVCWISSSGVLRFGMDLEGNTNGYKPPTGRKIAIPNVILINCTAAARGANALPNTTLATRYDFTTTGGGVISIDKALISWSPAFAEPNSLTISNSGISEQLSFNGNGNRATIDNVGVGLTASQSQIALLSSGSSTGADITRGVFVRATANVLMQLVDTKGFAFTDLRTLFAVGDYYAINGSRASFTIDGWDLIGGFCRLEYCTDVTIKSVVLAGRLGPSSARSSSAVSISSGNTNILIDGVRSLDADGFPSGQYVTISGYANANIELVNLGSADSPLEGGNTTTYLVSVLSTWSSNYKIRRAWIKDLAGGRYIYYGAPSSLNNSLLQNIYCVSGSAGISYTANGTNLRVSGVRVTSAFAATNSLANGTYWHDYFLTDTSGRLLVLMNEPTSQTAAFITIANGAAFNGSQALVMPVIGMSAVIEQNYLALGHTGFANIDPTMSGAAIGNYDLTYQIDKNDGGGWSGEWVALTGANLSAETGIDHSKGVKLIVRIVTTTTNSAAISALTIGTTTTATAQQTLYPLASTDFTFSVKDTSNAAVTGFEWRLYLKDPVAGILGSTELAGAEYLASSGATFTHQYASDTDVVLQILKDGYVESTSEYVLNTTPISATTYLTPDYN